MVLLVGLGNPGARYQNTRHNAGFWVLERLAQRHGLAPASKRFQGLFQRGRIRGEDTGLLRPQTYMNLSGRSVAEAMRYLPVPDEQRLVVIYDDLDLPAGQLRIRLKGGHGGHNGMRSIIECLGTQAFPRLRLGVGRPADDGTGARSPADHLLARTSAEQREPLDAAAERAADATEYLLAKGVEAAMNAYN